MYTLGEMKKLVVVVVLAAIMVASYWIAFDPSFQDLAIVSVGQIFAAIGVFAAKNSTTDDYEKALKALSGSALSMVGMFTTVDPNTPQVIGAVIMVIVQVVAVAKTRNDSFDSGVTAPATVSDHRG